MVCGYQRQHRKSINYLPAEGGNTKTVDQYTKCITHANQYRGILEKYSRACEESAISGMVLMQPYLDFQDDGINGTLDLKVWSYNSFLVDPYFRQPDMSDANFVWCQQYISKQEAETMFPERVRKIYPMAGTPQRYGNFYFLPENYNMARNDLLVLSYVWYKWRRKRKKLYNRQSNEIYDFTGQEGEIDEVVREIGTDVLEVVEVEIPSWKQAVVLNDQLMFQGFNPLGFDGCPFIPVYWNYDPQLAYYDMRVRSLVRPARDAQYLLNRKIIINNDITEATINAGWKRKENAVANEDNLKKSGQGWDIIIRDGYEMTDVEKIQASGVPESDMALADQLFDMVFKTTGVSFENFGWNENNQANESGIKVALKQGAALVALQKYFDQWDTALKLLGDLELQIVQNNWSPAKISRMIGEECTPEFKSKMFSRYHVTVAEGMNTPVQQMTQFNQLLELNQVLGGIIPPRFILQHATLQGKEELIQAIEEQQQQAQAAQQHSQQLEDAILDAKLQELQSKAVANIATARERHGRSESNIGLFEERLSEISTNRSSSTKSKVESLEKLLGIINMYGSTETSLAAQELMTLDRNQEFEENREKEDAKQTSLANDFFNSIMKSKQSLQLGGQNGENDQRPQTGHGF